jgi:hypothetical protein
MQHQFGPGFGGDAFKLFMQSRGRFVGDLAGTSGKGGGGMGLSSLLMMLMMVVKWSL